MNLEDLPTSDDWGDYDWGEVLGARTNRAGFGGEPAEPVTADRIAEILHWHGSSPEGGGSKDFYAVVRLTDGTFAVSEAWADYTGWGCQDDAWWRVADTLQGALGELSQSNREAIRGDA